MNTKRLNRWQWVTIVMVIAATLMTRFWQLENRVDTLWVDEAWFSVKALDLLAGGALIPLETPGTGRGDSLYQIYTSALLELLGAPAPFLSRYSSAVMGSTAVGVFAFFWFHLWRSKIGRSAAIWAALAGSFLLATTFTTILHSRNGLQMSAAVLLTVIVFWLLWRTITRFQIRDAVLTGLALAVAQTTYEAALALPLATVALFVLRWWVEGAVPGRRRRLFYLLLAITASALVFYSPLIVFYSHNPGIFLGHVRQTQAVIGPEEQSILQRLWALATAAAVGFGDIGLSVFALGDGNFGRNFPGRPLFDWFVALGAAGGIIWVLRRHFRDSVGQLVLVWLMVMILPAALSDTRPAFSRMLPLVPLLAGCAGLGLVAMWRWAADKGGGAGRVAGVLLAAGLAISATNNWTDYVAWSEDPALFDFFYQGARQTAEQAIALDNRPHHSVFVTNQSGPFTRLPFQLLLDPHDIKTFDVTAQCFPFAADGDETIWYGVINELDDYTVDHLRWGYGETINPEKIAITHPVFGDDFASFYSVAPDAPGPTPETEVAAVFDSRIELVGYEIAIEKETLSLVTYWQGDRLPYNAKLFIHIGVGDQSDPFIAQSDERLCPGFGTVTWEPGLLMVHHSEVTLPAAADLSDADIRIGLTDSSGIQRLPITAASNRVENNRLILEKLGLPEANVQK